MYISEHEAQERLEAAIHAAGSASALEKLIGTTPGVISAMRATSKRPQNIAGKVANYLGLRKVTAYEDIKNKKDTRQEQYEEKQRAFRAEQGYPMVKSQSTRVSLPPVPVQIFPSKRRYSINDIERLSAEDAKAYHLRVVGAAVAGEDKE